MAWTSVGFDGTITEIQWAGLAGLLGNGYVAAGNGDCLVTAVPGARSVSVAAGSLYGDGVLSTNSGAETVAMTTPVNGQWYVIALRRTWATNTAALVAIAGATTTTTTPTAPPTSFPVLNTNVGVLTDQPIAWAWCNSANTTVVVYDIRLKAVKSLPPVVATSAERDAKFMSPTQGLQVWRDDLGAVETYYGLYNSSTNPGGRDTAGWYVNDRQTGSILVKPSTVTIATGSGTTDALGSVTFTGATKISLDGVFTGNYRNYIIVLNSVGSGSMEVYYRWRVAGSEVTSAYYGSSQTYAYNANIQTGASRNNGTEGFLTLISTPPSQTVINAYPVGGAQSSYLSNSYASGARIWTGGYEAGTSGTKPDGFAIFPNGGTMTGSITVYGVAF